MRTIWPIVYVKRKMHERAAKRKEETPTDRAARISATATAWMAIFTLVLMLVGVGTYFILKNQLHKMHEGGTQTDKIIAAANLIESHQKQIVDDNKKILSDNRNALAESLAENRREIDLTIKQNRQAFEISERDIKRVLDASIEASRTDQRAWVGVIEVASPPELRQGTVLNSTVTISNQGKTPAYNVIQRAGFRIIKNGDQFDPEREVAASSPQTQGIIMPSGKRELSICTLGAIGSQRADELNSGEYRLFLFGKITYDDAFGRHHQTRFCMVMEIPSPHSFSPYDDYDYAN